MSSEDLAARYVELLRDAGTNVQVDLSDDPPAILAHSSSGRVFSAAWPSEEGLVIRMRLDAVAGEGFPPMEYVGGGTLGYEMIMRSSDELESFRRVLRLAHALASRRSED